MESPASSRNDVVASPQAAHALRDVASAPRLRRSAMRLGCPGPPAIGRTTDSIDCFRLLRYRARSPSNRSIVARTALARAAEFTSMVNLRFSMRILPISTVCRPARFPSVGLIHGMVASTKSPLRSNFPSGVFGGTPFYLRPAFCSAARAR